MPATVQQPNKTVIIKGIIILLLLLFCVTLTGNAFVTWFIGPQSTYVRFIISRALYWGCLVFAWYYCAKIEKQKLLLCPEQKQPFWMYLLSLIVIYVVLSMGSAIIFAVFKRSGVTINHAREQALMALLRGKYALMLMASITAGIVEELLFRGYLIPRLQVVFKNRYIAVIISSALFGLLHFGYNNWYHIVVAAFIGFVFALHYIRYRNIKILIITHFLWDFVIILLNTR